MIFRPRVLISIPHLRFQVSVFKFCVKSRPSLQLEYSYLRCLETNPLPPINIGRHLWLENMLGSVLYIAPIGLSCVRKWMSWLNLLSHKELKESHVCSQILVNSTLSFHYWCTRISCPLRRQKFYPPYTFKPLNIKGDEPFSWDAQGFKFRGNNYNLAMLPIEKKA